jgi:hypothetical protein
VQRRVSGPGGDVEQALARAPGHRIEQVVARHVVDQLGDGCVVPERPHRAVRPLELRRRVRRGFGHAFSWVWAVAAFSPSP